MNTSTANSTTVTTTDNAATRLQVPRFHPDFLKKYDSIVFDMDGVIWHAYHFLNNIPSILNSLQDPTQANKEIFFCTNSSTAHRSSYVPIFDKGGVTFDQSRLYTSASTAANVARFEFFGLSGEPTLSVTGLDGPIAAPAESDSAALAALAATATAATAENPNANKKVIVIGQHGLLEECKDYGLAPYMVTLKEARKGCETMLDVKNFVLDPDVIGIVVGLQADISWIDCAIIVMYVRENNARFLVTNRDLTFTSSNTRQLPCTGSIVNFIEGSCGGIKAETMGKPERFMIDSIVRDHKIDLSRTLMVGDRLDTDMLFGNRWGMDTMLVCSGVNKKEDIMQSYDLLGETTLPADHGNVKVPGHPLPTYWADDITALLHDGGLNK